MSLTNYQRAAKRAIEEHLEVNDDQEAIDFWYLAEGVADPAAYAAGKKRELFYSLWDYEEVLPDACDVFWHGGMARVRNPHYEGVPVMQPQQAQAGFFDAAIDMGPGQAFLPHSA